MDLAQCFTASGCVPSLQHGDLAAVDHAEGRDIDRLALAMFGYLTGLGIVAAAAGVVRGNLDLAQAASFTRERWSGAIVDP